MEQVRIRNDQESERIRSDSGLKAAAEALLRGDECSDEGLTGGQRVLFEKMKEAAEAEGKELCRETYLNPEYGAVICGMLSDFFVPYIQCRDAREDAVRRIGCLPDSMRQRRAIPFVRAYAAESGENLPCLLEECDDDTRIEQLPLLFDKPLYGKRKAMLTAEMNRFLGWLNFDVSSLIAAVSENIRNAFSGGNGRALEIFALYVRGETLESIGNRYGITRERVRQIEKKGEEIFWNIYKKQKYDLIMLLYASRSGDSVLPFNEVREAVGETLATVLRTFVRYKANHSLYDYVKELDAIVIKTGETEDG